MESSTFLLTWKALNSWFINRGYSSQIAEEMAAETILRVTQAGKLAEPLRYYYQAARSVVVDHMRRDRPTEELVDTLVVEDVYEFESRDIRQAVEALSPLGRQALQLLVDGVPPYQVAILVGRSRSWVYLLRRGLRHAVGEREATEIHGCGALTAPPGPEDSNRHERVAVA